MEVAVVKNGTTWGSTIFDSVNLKNVNVKKRLVVKSNSNLTPLSWSWIWPLNVFSLLWCYPSQRPRCLSNFNF